MSRSYRSVAASVAENKLKRPHAYCAAPRCLWRLSSGPCPKHKFVSESPGIVDVLEAKAYRRYLCVKCHVNAPQTNSMLCRECDADRGVVA